MIVLQPQGSLDLQGGTVFKEQLASLMPQPHDIWVIDLAQVDIVNSSGLVALVTGLSAAHQSGCRLLLCNVQAPVRIVFELTRLDEVFEIFESYDVAMTSVSLTDCAIPVLSDPEQIRKDESVCETKLRLQGVALPG